MLDTLTQNLLNTVLLGILAAALWTDISARRIPNFLVLAGLGAGMLGHAILGGGAGLATAVAGAAVGLLCLLPFYTTGGMGAGDVKLMAVCGAYLGPVLVTVAAAASLLVGGVIGVLWYFRADDVPAPTHATGPRPITDARTRKPGPTTGRPGIPYAFAIAAGAVISLAAADIVAAVIKGGISG